MELEQIYNITIKLHLLYYIIPIWNWSSTKSRPLNIDISITLFLYGIGASSKEVINHGIDGLHYSYMELEQKFIHTWCSCIDYNYIIPIWNWSFPPSYFYARP